jgi:8-oxo-dGTP pyrophosphatase MutT (NUDIX family)
MISKIVWPGFAKKFDVVSVFIICDDKILLLKRAVTKPQGGTWCVPAGKTEPHESLVHAIAREVHEETGFLLPESQYVYSTTYFTNIGTYDYVYHVFATSIERMPQLILNTTEHTEYMWISPQEALSMDLITDEDVCIRDHFKISATA